MVRTIMFSAHKVACTLLAVLAAHVATTTLALAQAEQAPRNQLREEINENVVSIISGNPNGGFLYTAYDIAAVLEYNSDVRVLPIVGQGGAQNIRDVLYLKGIDMGIVHPHIISYYKRTGELGPNIDRRIAYITPLFADELHVIASDKIESFADLNGKRVNFSNVGSGTQLTVKVIFDLLNMQAEEVNVGQTDAFEMIKRGELDATLCTCAKPLRSVASIKPGDGLKLLPVPYPPELEEEFLPGFLSHSDYPALIPEGTDIETIAVQTVLAVFNWSTVNPRTVAIEKFIDAFFSNISKFHEPPRNPKWRSVNIAADVRTMQRFAPAQAWLDANMPKLTTASTSATAAEVPSAIDERLARRQAEAAAPGDPEMQRRLFDEFMAWMKRRQASTPTSEQ